MPWSTIFSAPALKPPSGVSKLDNPPGRLKSAFTVCPERLSMIFKLYFSFVINSIPMALKIHVYSDHGYDI